MPSDAIRIAYLRRLLSPQVRDSIASYLHNPELYQDALKDLRHPYGDRRLIAQYSLKALRGMEPLKQSLTDLPGAVPTPLRNTDLKELDRFSCELHGIICSLVKSGHEAETIPAGNLQDVVSKLTPRLREKWKEKARSLPCPVNLQSLDELLCDFVLTKRSAAIFDDGPTPKPFTSRFKKAAGVNVVVKDKEAHAKCALCVEAYQSEIDSLVQNGIAKKEVASETDSRKGRAWYLPHHGVRSVAKPDKLRVVFDDSAVFNGISLNNMLSKGPPLLNDLCDLLI
uniref:Uncharacterized protein n=1 Tax=Trichuris muris TaxID=70415 RepID=A0A5S6QBS4_TRIMR